MSQARFNEVNFHIPKLQLLEIFPLTPFLLNYDALSCLDVGANTGLWCEAFVKTHGGRTNDYAAFEPMPGNVERFNRRIEAHLKDFQNRLLVNECCVGAKNSTVEIFFDSEVTTLASVANRQSDVGHKVVLLGNSRPVRQVALDSYCANLQTGVTHLLKIDVEGYEFEVLQGAAGLMSAGRLRNVFFEFGTHQAVRGQSFRQFFELLSDHGFSLYMSFRGKNYFGLNRISRYSRDFEPTEKTVDMFLATLDGPSPDYVGPRVVGQIN